MRFKERGIAKKDLTRDAVFKLRLGMERKTRRHYIRAAQEIRRRHAIGTAPVYRDGRDDLSEAVIDTFIHLHKKGLIYRGVRMVNWDPQGKTAVSDEEVIRKEVKLKLYYIKYKVSSITYQDEAQKSSDLILDTSYLTIATTRPETIMADAAICINPNDEQVFAPAWQKGVDPIN